MPNLLICFAFICANCLISATLFAGACVVQSESEVGLSGASDRNSITDYGHWDGEEPFVKLGGELSGGFGSIDGDDRIYSGPAQLGTFSFGPYSSFPKTEIVRFNASIEFSTNWSPHTHEGCVNHKYKSNGTRVCVERATFIEPTSFAVVVTRNEEGVLGTPIYTKIFQNLNHIDHGHIQLPQIECAGELRDLEVQVRDFRGGSLTFVLHDLQIDARWRHIPDASN